MTTNSTSEPRWWNRILRPSIEMDADRLQSEVVDHDARPIRDCVVGQPSTFHGLLKSVTLRPVQGAPVVEADLWDGTGQINIVFLGRRRIPGITPGRHLVIHGRPIMREGQLTMMNPRYELLAAQTD
ncbi:MAG: OB-fold nucleic acid binding domain-containing protein [Actinomycetes bacterium]